MTSSHPEASALASGPPTRRDVHVPLWKSLLYQLTPAHANVLVAVTPEFDVMESRPDPTISMLGHAALTLLYAPLCIAFFVFIIAGWVNRPYAAMWQVVPTASLPPVAISINVTCSNPPWCGSITVNQNYSASTTGCAVVPSFKETLAAPAANADGSFPSQTLVVDAVLCYPGQVILPVLHVVTPLFPTVPLLQVEFSAVNPGLNSSVAPNVAMPQRAASGIVTISSSSTLHIMRVVTVESWQVKTALFKPSMVVCNGDTNGCEDSAGQPSLLAEGIEYNGKRKTWRATLFLALTSTAGLDVHSRTPAWSFIDSLGTAFYGTTIVLVAMVWFVPLARGLFYSPDARQFLEEQRATIMVTEDQIAEL